jgi:hypothetical protein
MGRRPIRIPGADHPLLDIHSGGRAGPATWRSFSPAEIQQIARTVRRAPEVMVKVTGGGTKRGAVSAHFDYISRHGQLEIETDDGEHARGRDEQKELLKNWHLELTAGHYRPSREGKEAARPVKLVHNIVLSMPAPTPPETVLAAARKFTREKFAASHRYAMVLHTDQPNPHVHIVVKAESEYGRRLHIDKQMLREWREDFARLMREQGVAANATPRIIRGRNKSKTKDAVLRAQKRGTSYAVRDRVAETAREIRQTGRVTDPARRKLMETRKAVTSHWNKTADALDAQGEVVLAGEVRQFARRLPPVLTVKERIALGLVRILEANRSEAAQSVKPVRERGDDLTR